MRMRAFTLVETMMSVAVFAIMIAGVSTAFVAGRSAWEVNQNSMDVQTQVRAALWNISKDLRQAGISLSLAQTATAVTITFAHPADGPVTYAWTQDAASGMGNLTRQTTAMTRTIARNISALSLVNNGTDVVITATATGRSVTRKADTMTLKEKVVMR